MLKFKIQTICLKLLNILMAGNETNSTIDKIFRILNMVKEYNESFLHLILPSFCRILNNSKSCENISFLKGIIEYIKTILEFESSSSPANQRSSTPPTSSTRSSSASKTAKTPPKSPKTASSR